MISVTLNGELRELDLDPNTPLLWVLRDHLGLTGTKYGCGKAECGACTVHLDGVRVSSCVMPLSAVAGRAVTTIKGLSPDGRHPLQLAWIVEEVPRCGYCQSGQLMAAAALLSEHPTTHRCPNRCRHVPGAVPLRDLQSDPPRDPSRRQSRGSGWLRGPRRSA